MSQTYEWPITVLPWGAATFTAFNIPSTIDWYTNYALSATVSNPGATQCFLITPQYSSDGTTWTNFGIQTSDYQKILSGGTWNWSKTVQFTSANLPSNSALWSTMKVRLVLSQCADITVPATCNAGCILGYLPTAYAPLEAGATVNVTGVRAEILTGTGESTFLSGNQQPNTTVTICTLHIKNTGNKAGTINYKVGGKPGTGATVIHCTGVTVSLAAGQELGTPFVCNGTTPTVGCTWYLGMKVYGGTEPEPTWTTLGGITIAEGTNFVTVVVTVALIGGLLGLAYFACKKKR
jgi:hypothetical protein